MQSPLPVDLPHDAGAGRRNPVGSAIAVLLVVTVVAVVLLRPGGDETSAPVVDESGIVGLDALPASVDLARSWAPAPLTSDDGLSVLASSGPDGFALHTEGGDVGFLPGANLGSTTPGHQPGELAIERDDYARWFDAMGRLGVRVVRIYTIHPPAFYEELDRYNTQHPDAPLYLMHGVYLPDESYVEADKDLFDETATTAMQAEVLDAVAAVHGDLEREPVRGRAEGRWRTDVSRWNLGWLVGVEWDPFATARTDAQGAGQPMHEGTYFANTADSTPTERWIAARMDEVATAEAERGVSVPVAMVNWPTTDPLRHPDEPLAREDLVGVDANHVLPTTAWPAGTFASYHAYPYHPDFQRHEPALQVTRPDGEPDPYLTYLEQLKVHHAGMPLMVTEFGVPSSIGSAHEGTLGRDQGGHSEAEAMSMDAAMLRDIKDIGLAGGLLFAFGDEWFKFTWNTVEHQIPADRRQLWHDPLTNEQHFGLLAKDAVGPEQRPQQLGGGDGPVRSVTATYDESYLHLDVVLGPDSSGDPVTIGIDSVPDASGSSAPGSDDTDADWALVLDPASGSGQLHVRDEVDPVQVEWPITPVDRAPGPDGWNRFQLMTNRPLRVPTTGLELPAEFQDTGALRSGSWDPEDDDYDNRNLWRVDGDHLVARIPWAMAGMADPSSLQAFSRTGDDGRTPAAVAVDGLPLTVSVAGETVQLEPVRWEQWQRVYYRERLKDGVGVLRDALVATSSH